MILLRMDVKRAEEEMTATEHVAKYDRLDVLIFKNIYYVFEMMRDTERNFLSVGSLLKPEPLKSSRSSRSFAGIQVLYLPPLRNMQLELCL